MILLDYSQSSITCILKECSKSPTFKHSMNDVGIKSVILNNLKFFSRKFKNDYGNLVICCDNKTYWRKEVFPYYKHSRKKIREASPLDWNLIFNSLNSMRDSLRDNFPYKVVDVEGAEADDVIAALTEKYHEQEKILIISSDKDFVQLQKYKSVQQYSPYMEGMISTQNPARFVKEHILRGDRGDGIPNFLSADNTFVVGDRQKTITKKNLEEWLKSDPEQFLDTQVKKTGFNRNQILVDFDKIPATIKAAIVAVHKEATPAPKNKMLNYLLNNGFRHLIPEADEF